jgi:hypothetical protein
MNVKILRYCLKIHHFHLHVTISSHLPYTRVTYHTGMIFVVHKNICSLIQTTCSHLRSPLIPDIQPSYIYKYSLCHMGNMLSLTYKNQSGNDVQGNIECL